MTLKINIASSNSNSKSISSKLLRPLLSTPSLILSPNFLFNFINNNSHSQSQSQSQPQHNTNSDLFGFLQETMRRKSGKTFLITITAILVLAFFSLHLSRTAISGDDVVQFWYPLSDLTSFNTLQHDITYVAVDKTSKEEEEDENEGLSHRTRHVSSIKDSISTVSVLLADWDILVIVSPETPLSPVSGEEYMCLFSNNATSHARFSGVLPFTNRTTFKCKMPNSVRRRRPFTEPILTRASDNESSPSPTPELPRWTFLVYESFSTEDDVVLFAKGINHRQGINRPPPELRCLFRYGSDNVVKTAVTSSVQEVFRCQHPNPAEFGSGGAFEDERIRITLEVVEGEGIKGSVVPSVAYYTMRPTVEKSEPKSLMCACTMVHNVAKFLREWVMYHARTGVEKFILYDNDSDDDVESAIKELNLEGFDVKRVFWVWPKTQEGGFSHSALYAKDMCTWMMYVDVDEFVFSPSWLNDSIPPSAHTHLLKSTFLLEEKGKGNAQLVSLSLSQRPLIGQLSVKCNEFGPSGQRAHPIEGVTQGYTCRARVEQRHKSIVMLDAIDPSLLNVIHHFELMQNYRTKQVKLEDGVVNHYKYQAWPEFRTKFRRRVSAYVVDWTQAVNPSSKDRTPGLGFEPIEPEGWADKFCEVRDERLKTLTQRWFRSLTPEGYRMAWQR